MAHTLSTAPGRQKQVLAKASFRAVTLAEWELCSSAHNFILADEAEFVANVEQYPIHSAIPYDFAKETAALGFSSAHRTYLTPQDFPSRADHVAAPDPSRYALQPDYNVDTDEGFLVLDEVDSPQDPSSDLSSSDDIGPDDMDPPAGSSRAVKKKSKSRPATSKAPSSPQRSDILQSALSREKSAVPRAALVTGYRDYVRLNLTAGCQVRLRSDAKLRSGDSSQREGLSEPAFYLHTNTSTPAARVRWQGSTVYWVYWSDLVIVPDDECDVGLLTDLIRSVATGSISGQLGSQSAPNQRQLLERLLHRRRCLVARGAATVLALLNSVAILPVELAVVIAELASVRTQMLLSQARGVEATTGKSAAGVEEPEDSLTFGSDAI